MYYDEGRLRADGHPRVIFDGVDLNDYFEITAFGFSALPTISAVTTAIPGKAGQHYYSRQVGARNGTLRLTARAGENDPLNVIERWQELSQLINKDEPRPLYLDSDKYLNALMTGDTALEFLGDRGTVELSFTAFDPYWHGAIHEVPIQSGDNTFRVISSCETWPIIRVSGASAPLRVRNNNTYDEVRVPSVGSAEIKIDMEQMKAYSGGNYVPVDVEYTDFYSLPAGEEVTIWLSSGAGTLSYEERAL